jgi:RimJ/RimL family protein N-acetyltransferase
MSSITELWPLFGLRLRTGDLELRLPTDDDVADLAELTREPLHDPDRMPFFFPWTDQPEERRVRETLKWQWRARAEMEPDNWALEFVVRRRGEAVATQSLRGKNFAVAREVDTGSWVGRRFQGQGIATAMRRAVLHLAFAGLGAAAARSGAFEDNTASIKVSTKLGYRRDGTAVYTPRGEKATEVRFLLERAEWERRSAAWPEVTIEGLERCLPDLGLGPA